MRHVQIHTHRTVPISNTIKPAEIVLSSPFAEFYDIRSAPFRPKAAKNGLLSRIDPGTSMPWKKYNYKDQAVFVRVLPETGKPIVHRGRVEMRYRLGANKSYRGSPEQLVELEGEAVVSDAEFTGSAAAEGGSVAKDPGVIREAPTREVDQATIIIHTDGACSGNPGPAGIGVHIARAAEIVELSEFIGEGTNNIAELTAILRALEQLTEDEQRAHIVLYTDSGWSLGVLIGGWKAKANLNLLAKIKEKMALFPHLELLKVRGHAGQEGNEEADYLATMAVRRESSTTRTRRRSSPTPPAP
jgi:ribonuclease HI